MKIYINEKPILLLNEERAAREPKSANTLVLIYRGNVKLFHQVVDTFEKKNHYDAAIIVGRDQEKLISDFKGIFKIVAAAGGIVFNDEQKILAIFRRGHWDLPKGKIEEGESISDAAIREVVEETGIANVTLVGEVGATYHIYTQNKKRILKPTHWFAMRSTATEIIPQTTEDIELAEWLSKSELLEKDRPIYRNIVEVLQQV